MRPRLNINFLIAAVLMVGVSMATMYFDGTQKPEIMTLQPPVSDLAANPAPDVTFHTLDKQTHALKDYKGRGVILNIWASWCAPCLAEMPQLLKLAQDNPHDIILILLSVDSDEDAITRFFKAHSFTLPDNALLVWDKDKKISKDMFGTVRYPETVLIDKDGMMTQKVSGAVDWLGSDMAATLQKMRQ